MTNDDLSSIDALLARGQSLPYELAKLLRERLAACAAEAVALRKQASDVREQIVCAAIRLPDGRVIRGHRHDGCIKYAYDLVTWQNDPKSGVNGPPWTPEMARQQGFVTSRNRYVDRAEAMEIHRAAGGKSACYGELRGDVLFSEDCY